MSGASLNSSLFHVRREERLDTSIAKHQVGTVIQHKKYGYKGLIYGWDPTCRKPKRWVEENEKETKRREAMLPKIDSSGYPALTAQVGVDYVH